MGNDLISKYDDCLIEYFNRMFYPGYKIEVVFSRDDDIFNAILEGLKENRFVYPFIILSPDPSVKSNITEDKKTLRQKNGISKVSDANQEINVELSYLLTILTLTKEPCDLLQKFLQSHFDEKQYMNISIPSFTGNNITRRLGVKRNNAFEIKLTSGDMDFTDTGKLYQLQTHLVLDGCIIYKN